MREIKNPYTPKLKICVCWGKKKKKKKREAKSV
jgi:hypothetical protein